uniref:EOG090X07RL n=1 Tax=Scapholeberis mucronata TaxID=202097 RepID=A0A4Y7NKH5_9CRUS|nr:EOG090X07RL [Scapholeberis mucronata]SVE93672.1 EOG090X07RL [Scapholeberis mucronata]
MALNSRRGALRHKQLAETEEKDKFEDLLVFGYACKLFRDDEKAFDIDQGKFLIPWMGDYSIKIDRYDARGTLFDLKPHESPQGGYDRTEGLTAEERHIERLCDEERYFALYKDEAEEAVIKEEEIKRLNQDLNEVTSEEVSYHQVPFSYTSSSEPHNSNKNTNEAPLQSTLGELGDAVYVPPPMLDVPPDIIVPPTQKLARIVEKTALFISCQGTQMEIIVKAKQANNPMFQFLHFDNALHPFYRHVLATIRNGTYVVPAEDSTEVNDKVETNDNQQQSAHSDSESESYLHPSLQPRTVPDPSTSPVVESSDSAQLSNPSEDTRLFIDKTASYISRNGRHLESPVQKKGDERFVFLHPEHPFHGYYLKKLSVYGDIFREQEKQKALKGGEVKAVESTSNTKPVITDPESMKTQRRMKAALFLDQMKRDRGSSSIAGKYTLEDDLTAESESTNSTTKLSKSVSPDDIEIIGAIRVRDRTHSRSMSRSPTQRRPGVKRRPVRRPSRSVSRSRSRSLTKSRSRSRTRHRSSSRTGRRSRSRARPVRRSPSPDRRRRQHKKHRSRDRQRKDKKKRRSRDRLKKKRRHRSRSRSGIRAKVIAMIEGDKK